MRRSPSPQVLIDAGPKCLIKLPAKTSNGLDTYFVHYYEVNNAGKILKFMALDDGAGLAKWARRRRSPRIKGKGRGIKTCPGSSSVEQSSLISP